MMVAGKEVENSAVVNEAVARAGRKYERVKDNRY
jgi:hypothetical protein